MERTFPLKSNKLPTHELSPRRLYQYFKLRTYQPAELGAVFDEIVGDDKELNQENLQAYLIRRIRHMEGIVDNDDDDPHEAPRRSFATLEAQQVLKLLGSTTSSTRSEFVNAMSSMATKVDMRRSLPITVSMLLVGSSVGIMTPAMPFIMSHLELTHAQFGLVISAFALSKMIGNIPSAILVERHGRKPYLTYSLLIVGIGTGCVGLSSSFEELFLCRLLAGAGVAALSTGATMMMTDISTPLNRASTIAPIMSAWSAGAALGPALGGYLVDNVGVHPTFYVVGISFMSVAVLNRVIMSETKAEAIRFPWQEKIGANPGDDSMVNATRAAMSQWGPLLQTPGVRVVMFMNALYWLALAGSQMTLLPLMLTDPNGLAMTATQVGQVYMGMSLIQVGKDLCKIKTSLSSSKSCRLNSSRPQIFGNPVFARFADRIGKGPAIVGGCALISVSMAALPFCHDYTHLAAALSVWAVGSSMLSTAPVAYVSDKVSDSKRAQALALLRTCGDVGFLLGASGVGALSDWAGSMDIAMQSCAGLLLTGTLLFAVRMRINP